MGPVSGIRHDSGSASEQKASSLNPLHSGTSDVAVPVTNVAVSVTVAIVLVAVAVIVAVVFVEVADAVVDVAVIVVVVLVVAEVFVMDVVVALVAVLVFVHAPHMAGHTSVSSGLPSQSPPVAQISGSSVSPQ